MFPQFHVFPQFPLPFCIPDYENLTDLTFSSSQNFLFEAARMIQPKDTYYQLVDAAANDSRASCTLLRPVAHERIFPLL
jgi:hypothetical protein